MKLGLSLSGGGVKGAAHIGVLKALEEENIKIDSIAGTSSGSIVASLYAMGFRSDEIYTIFKKYCKKIKYIDFWNIIKLIYGLVFKRKIIIDGLNSGKEIEKLIGGSKALANVNRVFYFIQDDKRRVFNRHHASSIRIKNRILQSFAVMAFSFTRCALVHFNRRA